MRRHSINMSGVAGSNPRLAHRTMNEIYVYQTKRGVLALVASSDKHAQEILEWLEQPNATRVGKLDPDEPGTYIAIQIDTTPC